MDPDTCDTASASALACSYPPHHALGSSLSIRPAGQLTGPASSRLRLRAESVKGACCRGNVCDAVAYMVADSRSGCWLVQREAWSVIRGW